MTLHYLIFDASDDGEGNGTWEAMASVPPDDLPTVLAEVHAILSMAERQAPGPRGPLDEGGLWDADIQQQHEGSWITVTLSITGPWIWGEDLIAEWQQ